MYHGSGPVLTGPVAVLKVWWRALTDWNRPGGTLVEPQPAGADSFRAIALGLSYLANLLIRLVQKKDGADTVARRLSVAASTP